jgi:hypothetical protein
LEFPGSGLRPAFFIGEGNIMNQEQIFERWQAWIKIISDEIQGLLINRYIFWEVQKIIKSNPKIQIGSAFYDWMGIIYPAAMAMGVRRQIDFRRDIISFARLLKEIQRNPVILSRERYLILV